MPEFLILGGAPVAIAILLCGALCRTRTNHRRAFTVGVLAVVWAAGVLFVAIASVVTRTPVTLVGWICLVARDATWALIVARALLAVELISGHLCVARLASEVSPRMVAPGSAGRRGAA